MTDNEAAAITAICGELCVSGYEAHEVYRNVAIRILHALTTGGYTVVKLPASYGADDDGQEYFSDGDIRVDHTAKGSGHPSVYVNGIPVGPSQLRIDAAELLAAADAAERAE